MSHKRQRAACPQALRYLIRSKRLPFYCMLEAVKKQAATSVHGDCGLMNNQRLKNQ